MRNLFSKLFAPRKSTASRKPAPARRKQLGIEALESRYVLSAAALTIPALGHFSIPQAQQGQLSLDNAANSATAAVHTSNQPAAAPSRTPWVSSYAMTWDQFTAKLNSLGSQGYHLVDVSGYNIGGHSQYAAIWKQSASPAMVVWDATDASFQAKSNTLVAQGFRLVHLTGYTDAGQVYYNGIFEQSAGPAWKAFRGLTRAEYLSAYNSGVSLGYRPVDISAYNVGSKVYYTAIFQKSSGPAFVVDSDMPGFALQARFNSMVSQGYRETEVTGFDVGGQAHYAIIWEKSAGPSWAAYAGLTSAQFQAKSDSLAALGAHLVHVSGYTVAGQVYYAGIWEAAA